MNVEAGNDAASESNSIRLSIAHLLLWLTTTSVALAVNQQVSKQLAREFGSIDGPLLSEMTTAWRLVVLAGYAAAPANGAALVGLFAAAVSLFRRRNFPAQAGHWLLVVLGVSYLTHVLRWYGSNLTDWPHWASASFGTADAIPALLFVLSAVRCRTERRWLFTFVLLASGHLGRLLGMVLMLELRDIAVFPGISLLLIVPALLLLCGYLMGLGSAFIDLLARTPRDAFHWIGVIVLLVTTVEFIAAQWLSL
jgi:hypothetical protein